MDLINGTQFLRMIAALVFVLGLMGGLHLILRRFAHGQSALIPPQKRRLKIVESITLDPRRRAILLRRDNREHLVILGPSGETVVETGIPTSADAEKAADDSTP